MDSVALEAPKTEVIEHAPEVTETDSARDSVELNPSEMKEPYLIEIIDGLKFAKGQFEMPNLIKEINDFLIDGADSKERYEEVIEKYLKKLNLPLKIDVYTKIEKLVELIRIDKKLLEAAKAKEELLKKPITEMTSNQIKQRLEWHKI